MKQIVFNTLFILIFSLFSSCTGSKAIVNEPTTDDTEVYNIELEVGKYRWHSFTPEVFLSKKGRHKAGAIYNVTGKDGCRAVFSFVAGGQTSNTFISPKIRIMYFKNDKATNNVGLRKIKGIEPSKKLTLQYIEDGTAQKLVDTYSPY